MYNLKHTIYRVNNIIKDCNSSISQINIQENPENLLNEDVYLFTNEFEEVELLKGNNITELDTIDSINNIQEYESDMIDEIYLSSDSMSSNNEITDIE